MVGLLALASALSFTFENFNFSFIDIWAFPHMFAQTSHSRDLI